MEVIYTTHAQEDRDYWELKNPELIKRIDKLIKTFKNILLKALANQNHSNLKKQVTGRDGLLENIA